MQCTGLTDMNGTDIYERDIIKDLHDGKVYLVKWSPGDVGFVAENENYESGLSLYDWTDGSDGYNPMGAEVIGNIHQDSELLEEERK